MPGRILWLDNDPSYLDPFVDALKDEDYSVEVVSAVDDAEQRIKASQYDLLILDVMIPTKGEGEEVRYSPEETDRGAKTGLLFYTQNKDELKGSNTRVFVMTVRLDEKIVRDFVNAGLTRDCFATKYEVRDVSSFLERIKSILRKPQS